MKVNANFACPVCKQEVPQKGVDTGVIVQYVKGTNEEKLQILSKLGHDCNTKLN